MLTRAITGTLFVASILLSTWFNHYVAIGVFSLFYVGSLIEYARMLSKHDKLQFGNVSFIVIGTLLYAALVSIYLLQLHPGFLVLCIPLSFLYVVLELWRKKTEALLNISAGIFGLFYLLIPFLLMLILLEQSSHQTPFLIGMFLLIWTNDTFAYLCGRFLGKHKLFERISPKKTWEGSIGGFLFTMLVGTLIGFWNEGSHLYFWIIAAAIVSPSAVLGDLLESLFKRNLNIKDSGTILPGHGGILDRFDATIYTLPFFFSWLVIYSYFC